MLPLLLTLFDLRIAPLASISPEFDPDGEILRFCGDSGARVAARTDARPEAPAPRPASAEQVPAS